MKPSEWNPRLEIIQGTNTTDCYAQSLEEFSKLIYAQLCQLDHANQSEALQLSPAQIRVPRSGDADVA